MSKQSKKRNKPYSGQDAKQTSGPRVTRYTAKVRSPLGEWWHDHKKPVKLIAGIGGGAALLGWLLFEAIRLIV